MTDHPGARVVRLLEEDPELAEGIPADQRERAIREAVAVVHTSPRGPIEPYVPAQRDPADMGVLLLDGFAGLTTALSGRSSLELLGPGDFGRPWEFLDDDNGAVPVETRWTVIQPIRWAVLDARFARIAGQWPELVSALLSRAMERTRRQSLYSAAAVLPRLQDRLVVLLWLAADRWGRVTPDGVVVPIRMTQTQLAALAGARRPSVSTAMTALGARGVVVRQRGGGWCLTAKAAEHVAGISAGDDDEALRSAASAASRLVPPR